MADTQHSDSSTNSIKALPTQKNDILEGNPKDRALLRAASFGHLGIIEGVCRTVDVDQQKARMESATESVSTALPSINENTNTSHQEMTKFDFLMTAQTDETTSVLRSAKEGHSKTLRVYLKSLPSDVRHGLLLQQDNAGESALMLAAIHGHTEVVETILNAVTPDILHHLLIQQNKNGHNPLMLAAKHEHKNVVDMLLKNVSPNQRYDLLTFQYSDSLSALEFTMRNGYCSILGVMLASLTPKEKKEVFMERHDTCQSLLWLAIQHNQPTAVDTILHSISHELKCELLDKFLTICGPKPHMYSQVIKHLLCSIGSASQTDLLLKQDDEGSFHLFCAALRDQADIVSAILGNVSSELKQKMLSQRSKNGHTPLSIAIIHGYANVVIAIVNNVSLEELETLLREVNNNGSTALLLAASHGYTDIIQILLKYLSHQSRYELLKLENKFENTPVITAVKHGHAQVIRGIADLLHPNQMYNLLRIQNEKGNTALSLASSLGYTKVVETILNLVTLKQKQELMMLCNKEGDTAISHAACNSHLSTVQCFLSTSINLNICAILKIQNNLGKTCVHHAAFHGYTEVLLELLSAVTQLEKYELLSLEDCKGNIALTGAVTGRHLGTVCAILNTVESAQRHKMLSLCNDSKRTALHFAAFKGLTDIADAILNSVSEEEQLDLLFIHDKPADMDTPIFEAVTQGHVGTFKRMIYVVEPSDRCRVLLIPNHEGEIAPQAVLAAGHFDMVQAILEVSPCAYLEKPCLCADLLGGNAQGADSNASTTITSELRDQERQKILNSNLDIYEETQTAVPQPLEHKSNLMACDANVDNEDNRQIAGCLSLSEVDIEKNSNGESTLCNNLSSSGNSVQASIELLNIPIHTKSHLRSTSDNDCSKSMDSSAVFVQESFLQEGPQKESGVDDAPATDNDKNEDNRATSLLFEKALQENMKRFNFTLQAKKFFHDRKDPSAEDKITSREVESHVKKIFDKDNAIDTGGKNSKHLIVWLQHLRKLWLQVCNITAKVKEIESIPKNQSGRDESNEDTQNGNDGRPTEEAEGLETPPPKEQLKNDLNGVTDEPVSYSNLTQPESHNKDRSIAVQENESIPSEDQQASFPVERSEPSVKFLELTPGANGAGHQTQDQDTTSSDVRNTAGRPFDYSDWSQVSSQLLEIMTKQNVRDGRFHVENGEIVVSLPDKESKSQVIQEMEKAAKTYGYTLVAEELQCAGEKPELHDFFTFAGGEAKPDSKEFYFANHDNLPDQKCITKIRLIMQAKDKQASNPDELQYFLLTPCHALLDDHQRKIALTDPRLDDWHRKDIRKHVLITFLEEGSYHMRVGSECKKLKGVPKSLYRALIANGPDTHFKFTENQSLLQDIMLIQMKKKEAEPLIRGFKTHQDGSQSSDLQANQSRFKCDDAEIVPIESTRELDEYCTKRRRISCNGKFGNLCPRPTILQDGRLLGIHLAFELDAGQQPLGKGDCGSLIYLEDGSRKRQILGQFIIKMGGRSQMYIAIVLHWNLKHVMEQQKLRLGDLQVALLWDPHVVKPEASIATNAESGLGSSLR